MNKISTPLGITIIIVAAFILAGGVLAYQYWWLPRQETPSSKNPSIIVLSPNGGEKFALGSTYPIIWCGSNWQNKNQGAGVDIYLVQGSQILSLLMTLDGPSWFDNCSAAPESQYSLNWVVGSVPPSGTITGIVTPGDNYFIRVVVTSVSGSTVAQDSSDAAFSITAPQATILYKTEWDDESLYDRLYKSEDSGETWKEILSQYKGEIIYAIDPKNPNIIYAGDTGGNMMAENMDIDLLKSTDAGEHWIDISKKITEQQVGVLYGIDSLQVDSNDSNIVNVTVIMQNESIIFKSLDRGNTWTKAITVLSPNGGEKWQQGSKRIIRWVSSDLRTKQVVIELLYPGEIPQGGPSTSWTYLYLGRIALTDNTGSFEWEVGKTDTGNVYGNNYKIRIREDIYVDIPIADDKSDAPFSITK